MTAFIRHAVLLIVALAVAAATHPTVAADALVWKFEPGLVNRYQMNQKMNMAMDMGKGGEAKSSVDQVIDMSWTVEKVNDDGSAVLKQRIDRMRMKMGLPGGQPPAEIDSASKEPPAGQAAMLSPLLKAMTSDAFTVQMKPSGEVTEVDVPKAMLDALASMPGAAMMGEMATADGFKNLVKQASFAIPENLEVGTEWTTKMEMKNPMTGPIVVETTYKYEGPREVDGKQYEVFKPHIELNYGEGGATKIEMAEQTSEGEILFDRQAGRLESSAIKQKMKQKFTVAGQVMNQAIDQSVDMKWMSEEAAEAEAAKTETESAEVEAVEPASK